MPKPPLLPSAPVRFVRADVSIGECIRILRDHSIGALVVLSDDVEENLVGIFTERDLVKNIELVQRGAFWDAPVRTVMTTTLRTITVADLNDAPKIMAKYNIRHLPLVEKKGDRTRVVGVFSMRDIFRVVMENFHYDLGRVFKQSEDLRKKEQKMVGVFSGDQALGEVVEKVSRMTPYLLMHSPLSSSSLDNLDEIFAKFHALFIDIDGLNAVNQAKILAEVKARGRKEKHFLAFSTGALSDKLKKELHQLAEGGHVTLLSKPIAVGLLYERFIREI